MGAIEVHEAVELTEAIGTAVGRLLPQLWDAGTPLRDGRLAEIVASPTTRLLLATVGVDVCGMAILVVAPLATGVKADLEDVVVDRRFRGRGVGRALTVAAVQLARERGAEEVCLTSHPSRVEANGLYRSLGFVLRDTNAYALTL